MAAAAPAPRRTYPVGWWGMVVLIMTEATVFAALLASYFYARASSAEWPQGGIEAPPLGRISVFTVVLLASSAPVVAGDLAIRRGDVRALRRWLSLTWVMGAAFLAHQVYEYTELTFGVRDNAYASLFYVTTGLHGLHVVVGLGLLAIVRAKALRGRFTADRHVTVTAISMYWHFVDVVWIFVFASLYLSPHIR
jgi:heme/copper-type cytochrome/quinol oxidase subunit 3